ncbi:MAG: uS10/mL48 family ribosomal protein [Candidatus Caldarchaeum sp.]
MPRSGEIHPQYAVFINVESHDHTLAFSVAQNIKDLVKKHGIEVYGPKALPRKRQLAQYLNHKYTLYAHPLQHTYRLAAFTDNDTMSHIIKQITNMPELNTPHIKITIQTRTKARKPEKHR